MTRLILDSHFGLHFLWAVVRWRWSAILMLSSSHKVHFPIAFSLSIDSLSRARLPTARLLFPTPHSQLWFCGHAIAPKPCITASFNCYEWGIQLRFGNRLLACLLSLSSTHSSSASISHTNYEAGFECVWVPFFHCTLNSQLSPN